MSKKPWDSSDIEDTGGEHVEHLLSPYIDNRLESEARSVVRRHLHECSDCRAAFVELQATRKLLGSLPTVPPPRAFTITPEMAGVRAKRTAAPRTLWERLFSPRNASRFAFGSVVALMLTAITLVSAVTSHESPYVASIPALDAAPPSANEYKIPVQGTAAPGALSLSTQSPSGNAAGLGATSNASGSAAGGGSSGVAATRKVPAGDSSAASAQATPTTAAAAPVAAESTGTPAAGATGGTVPSGVVEAASPVVQGDQSFSSQSSAATPEGFNDRTSVAPGPEGAHSPSTAAASPSGLSGLGLTLSLGVAFGVLTILLATAAFVSTRRTR